MKKLYSLILALMLGTAGAMAEEYTDASGMKYDIDKNARTATFNGLTEEATASVASLKIPDEVTYEGTVYPITAIAPNACVSNSNLTDVTFGKNIKTVGKTAFYGCANIVTVNFNQGLETIGESAFYDCRKHENLTLPEGLKTIGDYAFYRNDHIVGSISIPSTLESIGANPFAGSVNITEFVVPADNKNFSAVDRVLFDKSGSILYAFPVSRNGGRDTRYTCPASTRKIGICAFRFDSRLQQITLNEGLEEIGEQAFNGCDLRSIEIPASVKNIGARFLTSNSHLSSIKVAEGNTEFTVQDKMLFTKDLKRVLIGLSASEITFPDATETIDEYAFYRMAGLTKLDLNNVKTIGRAAFYNTSLREVNFGKALVSIGIQAFMQNSALQSVVFPSTLRDIGEGAFCLCRSINELKLNEGLRTIGGTAFIQCLGLTEVYLPGSLRTIDESAFYVCSNIKKVICGEGLEEIGNSMFYECTSLETVTLPSTLTTINSTAFAGCSSLKTIELPVSLKTIGRAAFQGSSLTEVKLPDNCLTIEESAFAYCNLAKFTAGKNLSTVGVGAVGGNNELTEVNLNEGLIMIGRLAFAQNPLLKSIVIPSTVMTIEEAAFSNDKALEYIENRATTPQTLKESIFGNDEDSRYSEVWLKVPAASIDAYKKANIWKNFRTIVDLNAGINDVIGEEAEIVEIYDLSGVRHDSLVRGVNIVKMSDGSVKKIISKD